jgi:hypothetical protein
MLSMPDCKTMSFTVIAGKAYAVNYVNICTTVDLKCVMYSLNACMFV